MKTYDFSSQFLNLCVCGDIHGEFKTLIYNLKRLGVENSVVILAGDCGIGFEKQGYYRQLYNSICKSLDKSNNMLLCVRGNHDDPAYFDGLQIDFERMKCIADYSVISLAERTVLCIGGAVSIDRMSRLSEMAIAHIRGEKPRPIYWENEVVRFDDAALSEISAIGIDAVVTHTCPSHCNIIKKPNTDSFLVSDEYLQDDLRTEKMLMDKIYQRLLADKHPLQAWYYGHFHLSQTEFINNIKFCLLNIDEIRAI